MDFDLVTKTVQSIIQGNVRTVDQVEAILATVPSDVRNAVVQQFLAADQLRSLFPEFAEMFDTHDFSHSN
jgi:hypothetical protein